MFKFWNKRQAAHGAYSVTVTFTREHDEDDEIAEGARRTLEQQLVTELQEAYDCGHIAGHFRISYVSPVTELD